MDGFFSCMAAVFASRHAVLALLLAVFAIPAKAQEKLHLSPQDYGRWNTMETGPVSPDGRWVAALIKNPKGNILHLKSLDGVRSLNFPSGNSPVFATGWFGCLQQGRAVLVDLATLKEQVIPGVTGIRFLKGHALLTMDGPSGSALHIIHLRSGRKLGVPSVKRYEFNEKAGAILCVPTAGEGVFHLPLNGSLGGNMISLGGDVNVLTVSWDTHGRGFGSTVQNFFKEKGLVYFDMVQRKIRTTWFSGHTMLRGHRLNEDSPLDLPGNAGRIFFEVLVDAETGIDSIVPEVWESRDPVIYPAQQLLDGWRTVPRLACWDFAAGKVSLVTSQAFPKWSLSPTGKHAILFNPLDNEPQHNQRPDIDYHLHNLDKGTTQLLASGLPFSNTMMFSPSGRYILFEDLEGFVVFDIIKSTRKRLSVERGKSFRVAGWNPNETEVVLENGTDVAVVSITTGVFRVITHDSGPGKSYRAIIPASAAHRSAGSLSIAGTLDLNQGLLMAVRQDSVEGFAEWHAKKGLKGILLRGSSVTDVLKTSAPGRFVFVEQRYDSPPGLMCLDKGSVHKLLDSNPHHIEYHWGRSRLLQFALPSGKLSKGVLYYPAGYDPSKKYPMVVKIYQQQSSVLHRYVNPSAANGTGFNITNLTTNGYFVLLPDIEIIQGYPGSSAANSVVAAVRHAVQGASIDKGSIGLYGHSFGGFEAAYVMAHTNIFATAVIGAAKYDLINGYFYAGWNNARPDYWRMETGQYNLGKSYFEDPALYLANSPILQADKITAPILSWTGKEDLQVHHDQSLEFHLAMRRLGKPHTLLMYPGEEHVLTKEESKKDLTNRVEEWFERFLKHKI